MNRKLSDTQPIRDAILIAGPTASGKSALALTLAAQTGGVIINSDAMQVYDILRVITARPDDEALDQAPHLLYGHVHPSKAHSVAGWLKDVQGHVDSGVLAGRRPIFVGGTGLYLTALTEGLSEVPPVPDDIRHQWRSRLESDGPQALYEILQARDPEGAVLLKPADGQRIVRALEVLEASGTPLRVWQQQRSAPLVDAASALRFILEPDRKELHTRIDARFDQMIGQGAAREVAALQALKLDPALPAMRAIGVPELSKMLAGDLSEEEAITRAKAATRQYAKRQETWFRNQFQSGWSRLHWHNLIAEFAFVATAINDP